MYCKIEVHQEEKLFLFPVANKVATIDPLLQYLQLKYYVYILYKYINIHIHYRPHNSCIFTEIIPKDA